VEQAQLKVSQKYPGDVSKL